MSTAIHDTAIDDVALLLDARPNPGARHASSRGVPGEPAREDDAPRVYRGRTVAELIQRIQEELGRDAIVIRREAGLSGGFAGFFQRPFVEIEARRSAPAIDRYDDDDAAPAMPGDLDEAPVAAEASAGMRLPATPSRNPFAAALAEAEAAVRPAHETTLPAAAATLGTSIAMLPDAAPALSDAAAALPGANPISRSRARDAIERTLLGVGVGEELVRELLEAAAAHVMPFMPARTSLARAVHVALQQRIPVCRALPAANATIVVVGPGGSGKTACCAALLGAYRKRSALPAACVTIAEGEQRGVLAMLLSPQVPQPLPVGDPQALAALRGAREEGVVLLDTPPVSPVDRQSIRALATLLADLRPDRVVLALPATLGAKPAAQLLEALRPLDANALVITHAEETDQLGVAVEAACTSGLAPAYLLERGRGSGLVQVAPGDLAERLLAPR
jgi:flagellar biosynthesis protein FlhF